MNLLAIAVGIKQKKIVDQIFPSKDFVVMLFYYYGVVDERKDLVWADRAIHVSAANQTKYTRGRVYVHGWFAKHFLHPDIVAEYNYIFLWDEDIGVAIFNPRQYLSIVKDEGLEISQPALDPFKSEVHHLITARRRNSKAHRRIYKFKASGRCDDYSTAPPCIGWVEMMAPVFSKAAWRCRRSRFCLQSSYCSDFVNDLIHTCGLDVQLRYCAQVRRQSYIKMQISRNRWKHSVEDDQCWVDPYQQLANQTSH
ncbi:hypothetical protein CISIN_1g047246mg [Citrus sinensis]|uniref:Uncharacterized protein n=1 Tax=Citrus sinensis TaxID=2711 RepID=A0A067E3P8_CITSI|nr:hypothetical protein CISIN_1g047246mg [Citrus sinensis]